MNSNLRVYLVGYWLSSNLGDFVAPWLVFEELKAKNPGIQLFILNAGDADKGNYPSVIRFPNGQMAPILFPNSDFLSQVRVTDKFIFICGSLNGGLSQAIGLLLEQLAKKDCEIALWTGLQDYVGVLIAPPSTLNLNILYKWRCLLENKNIFFYARTQEDVDVLKNISQTSSCYSRITLGGDPFNLIFHKINNELNPFINEFEKTIETLFINSRYSWKCTAEASKIEKSFTVNPSDSQLIDLVSDERLAGNSHLREFFLGYPLEVISIDLVSDRDLTFNGMPIRVVNNLYHLILMIAKSKRVVSSRLHGAVLAAMVGTPVIALALNEKFYNINYSFPGHQAYHLAKNFYEVECLLNGEMWQDKSWPELGFSQAKSTIDLIMKQIGI